MVTLRHHSNASAGGSTALVALGFGIWQYWSVSREIKRDKDAKRTDRDE